MNEIAKAAAKEYAKTTGLAGYVTEDGQVFPIGKEGKNFCLSYCSRKLDAWQFNEKGEAVEPESDEAAREKAISKLASKYSDAELANMSTETLVKLAGDSETETNPTDGDGEVNLDKLNKAQLIELLVKLDPQEDADTLTKAKPKNDDLKDKIEAANALVGEAYDLPKLKALAVHFGAQDEAIESLDLDEVRSVVLYHRDGVELPESVTLKMTSQE
jgi:hypothetical protein